MSDIFCRDNFFSLFNKTIKREGPTAKLAVEFFCMLAGIAGPRRDIARRNLEFIFPSKPKFKREQILKESYKNLLWSFFEYAAWQKDPAYVNRVAAEVRGFEHLEEDISNGRRVIAVSACLGNWPLIAAWMEGQMRFSCLFGRHDEISALNDESLSDQLASEFQKSDVICVAGDRHGGSSGSQLPFLGQMANTGTLAARCALLSGAAVLVVTCTRISPYRCRINIGFPPEDGAQGDMTEVDFLTLQINRELERRILQFPEQWLWQQKRFIGEVDERL